MMRKLRVPEVRLARACGDDQAVVSHLAALVQRLHGETTAAEIDPDDLAEYNARVALVTQHLAERRRDVSFGEESSRHLVEQRLEQVVVGTVDERDVDIGAREPLGGKKPAEAAAYDRDAVPASNHCGIHLTDSDTAARPMGQRGDRLGGREEERAPRFSGAKVMRPP